MTAKLPECIEELIEVTTSLASRCIEHDGLAGRLDAYRAIAAVRAAFEPCERCEGRCSERSAPNGFWYHPGTGHDCTACNGTGRRGGV